MAYIYTLEGRIWSNILFVGVGASGTACMPGSRLGVLGFLFRAGWKELPESRFWGALDADYSQSGGRVFGRSVVVWRDLEISVLYEVKTPRADWRLVWSFRPALYKVSPYI